ncbi:MAG: DNA mismatch repair endonuclease MutL [Phycisphaeraceae bacterium]|nr:DNA mismatch repair endonuclease MutL [Phycisphaeraceae bacterium]
MPIKKLPTLLINQIAAGEVIERPASVVKELVENSLDAGASQIDVTIEDGGRQLIRIADNGGGIPESELHLSIEQHATSKLTTVEQLSHIDTMGFRGEALASISSVSRLRITSRSTVEGIVAESGAMLQTAGAVINPIEPAACAPGTTIEIRDLFFNTPARFKFMRASSTEFGHISDMLNRIAIARPDVGLTLSHNGRKTLDVLPSDDHVKRCVQVLSKDLADGLLEFEYHDTAREGQIQSPASVWGLAGLPSVAKATTKFQYIYVNGRAIRDRNLSHAIKEAYRGLIPSDKHPLAVVCLQIDPHGVDVNVHPTKAEVRFSEPSRMHGLVLHAIRQRLLQSDLTPNTSFSGPTTSFNRPDIDQLHTPDHTPDHAPGQSPDYSSRPSFPKPGETNTAPTTSDFVDYFKNMQPEQKGFVYKEVAKAMQDADPQALLKETPLSAWEQAQRNSPRGATVSPVLQEFGILQVHKSYLVTQDDQGIIIIDQHALHERVMFEELSQRILSKTLESQKLLMPATFDASARRIDLLEQIQPLLKKIGIEAGPMGPDTIGVHAYPTLLFDRKVDPIPFMNELLDQAEDDKLDATNPNVDEAVLHKVLDMMSCKAAVKAGDQLTQEELAALLKRRDEIERSSNCPHGRPTSIRLTLKELEKQFMRS